MPTNMKVNQTKVELSPDKVTVRYVDFSRKLHMHFERLTNAEQELENERALAEYTPSKISVPYEFVKKP